MTSMASVRLLQCPETLAEILSHLEPGPGSRVEHTHAIELEHRELRRTLAAAARSSQALTEHALNVLWRRLDSVQPLLSLLSNPQAEFPNTCNSINPESWLRFRTHARRVRVLHDMDWSTIHPSTWAFIGRWCGPEPLLPNLEELSVLPISVRSPTTMMFVSPKLRSLALRMDDHGHGHGRPLQGDSAIIYMLLRQIVSTAPGIRTLAVTNHLSLPSSCYYPFGSLENLEALYARECVLDFSLLWWLGSRPLHSLAATIDMTNLPPPSEDPEDEYDDYSPFDGGFDTLKHLTVRGTPEHIDLFLDNTVTCDLETLTVEFLRNASKEVITRCLENILEDALLGQPLLRELTIKYPYESHNVDDGDDDEDGSANTLRDALLVDVISPALRIRFLRKVTLHFHRIPTLTDAGLLQMIDAWPQLTALHITPSRDRYSSRVTLTPSVLVAFARRCPRLAELTLPEVPLHDVPAEKDMPLVGQRALRRLRVSFRERGRQHVLYKAALFIDRLFPCLTLNPSFEEEEEEPPSHSLIRMSWENNAREEERTWRRIEEFLYAMQLGRRHREQLKNASH